MWGIREQSVTRLITCIIIAVAIAGCQTTGDGSPTGSSSKYRVAKDSYTLFFDQKDHLEELVTAGDFSKASILYEEQQAYFDERIAEDKELIATIQAVVDNVSRAREPKIAATLDELEAIQWPSDANQWSTISEKLKKAERMIAEMPSDGVFVNPSFLPANLDKLKVATGGLRAKVDTSVRNDFAQFDHFADKAFFELHPSSQSAREFFDENPASLASTIEGQAAADIRRFGESIGKDNLNAEQWKTVSQAYVDARISALPGGKRSLSDILSIVSGAKNAGFEVDSLNAVKIGFVEVTSRTLLKQGQIEFPASVEVDLPFEVAKSELETAFDTATAESSDYLIVFDVALAKSRRKIGRMHKKSSQMIVGYKQEQNPEYTQLQNQITAAQMQVQNESMNVSMAQSQYCYGLACLGKAISVAAAGAKRDEAQTNLQGLMTRMNSTPMMIEVPIKRPYSYEVADIDASKTMTVHYYVIDKKKKRYFKSTFDVTENEGFAVAYRLQSSDPDAKKLAGNHDSESEVGEWEKQPSTVKLSQLIDHYLANQSRSRPLPSLTTLRKQMLDDRNTAIAEYKENTFEESTANDPRFDSVVAIYMPGGGLGSGFFVRPDIVMTNYHVVEESEFVELKMHDEQETFGKVIARDAVTDLALIRTQSRGKPARFFDKNKIELGSTVEVIGHPRGYEFSITRGVVSAIRKDKSVNLSGGSEVLFVQIDAATSPGNSGGPVFLEDYVVSVVSWGRVDRGSENLNFTVHHSLAEDFLRESLGGS